MRHPLLTAVALCLVALPPINSRAAEPVDETANSDKQFNAPQIEFFEKQIRPILSEHCFECHGPKKQESGLRLDARGSILKGGDSGAAVEPGKPDDSLLIDAVLHNDGLEMPPEGRLQPAAIDVLKQWVRMGLPWPHEENPVSSPHGKVVWKNHWAFQPIIKPGVPEVTDTNWPRTPLDHFILSKLEAAGIEPSPEADRKTLIRRATFDLIGLPPAPAEVDAFLSDPTSDAFEKVIDRLLASPHYGERWGRHWLDVARYADNKGYVFFEEKKFPWAYTYRDYVIRALNDDLSYDRFVLEQLAADQLELGTDKSPLTAMGFLTLGGRFMNNLHDVLDDRIDVVSRGLMGLTVTCARCHEHKFDPIPQADYYALYGVFRSSTEPILPPLFSAPPNTEEYRKFDTQMKTRQKKLDDFVRAKHGELVTSARTRVGEYLLAAHAKRNQPATDNFMLLVEEGGLNPMMVLRWQVFLEKVRRKDHPVWIPWHSYADLPAAEFAAQAPAVTASLAQNNTAPINPLLLHALVGKSPTSMNEVAGCYSELLITIDRQWQEAIKLARQQGEPVPRQLADPHAEELRAVFYGSNAPPDVPIMTGWGFLTLLPDRPAQNEFKKLLKEVETWSMTGPAAPPRAMVLVDAPSPYNPRVFMRGNPNRLGREVSRHFLSILDHEKKPFRNGSGRLELAESIVERSNPLTSRVIVNRIWLHHFGTGLVETPSDFGVRSTPPSHPKLLDYLADSFLSADWSIKRLHRQIMLSALYRQQSGGSRQTPAADAANRLYWKMNRQRLGFESTRDALLAVSGGLNETMNGPPLDLLGGKFVPRRTVYGFIDRMDLPGLMRAFDFPDPASTNPKRDVTTIAPQALYLMNNRFVVETGRRLINRPDVESIEKSEHRIQKIYQILFGRVPTEMEMRLAREYLTDAPTPELWSHLAQTLMMTNEFVFVD